MKSNRLMVIAACATALGCLCEPGIAHANDSVIFEAIDRGYRYRIQPAGMSFQYPYGTLTDAGYSLPLDYRIRPGCYAITPWVYIGTPSATGQFIPGIVATWSGVTRPTEGNVAGIGNMRVEVRHGDGTITPYTRSITSADMTLQPIYQYPDGSIVYQGRLTNSYRPNESHIVVSFGASEGDEVRVQMCDLVGGTALTINELVVQTF